MNYGFPNWMFAAIAIAAYEAGTYIESTLHVPHVQMISYVIIAVCLLIMGVRIGVRWLGRRGQTEEQNEDDWKSY
ncbi:MAG: hypothetical protein OWQ59_10345 [Alicyclobacillaceae bacterium]|jgi:membrane protein implicated in regulation of membrane protease activity|uniref:hypothetical protein n=1 Tax=Alicyclobacillus sp. SP_1 TaxID=2942475 RepID=UPI00215874AF|nr:hypothetical protein [Alicyclobacillus sp. SP_1]MCY0888843.1 hypothetical protein [Alicyclobacillaceae bacterium]MCY0897100.1 hypothetical protein [Alicyclobacillaceae bacterium]